MGLRNFAAVMIGTAGLLWAFGGSARANWTLVSGDFSEQKGLTVNTWDIGEGLSVTGESGKLAKVQTRDVLSLVSDQPPADAGQPWRLTLRNGDVFFGEPSRITGQSLEFNVPELGKILVPLKMVAAVANTHAKATGGADDAEAAEKDVVWFENKDERKGLIVNVDGDKVQIAVGEGSSRTKIDVAMSEVACLTFAGATAPRQLPSLAARITFLSGSMMTVPLDAKKGSFSWTINSVDVTDPSGKPRKAAADKISRVDVVGGRVVYLTELDPAKDEQTSYMGTHWPTQMNKNVMGEALKVGRKTYLNGLGVHARSHVSYDLDGSFDTLKFRVGMDDSAAPEGTADVSVVLDGKVLWESKGLKSGAVSEEIALPIKGGKRLELRADPALAGGKLDVLGRVDWLNVALVRQ